LRTRYTFGLAVALVGPLSCTPSGTVIPPEATTCSAFSAGCATDQGPQEPVDLIAADLDGDGGLDLAITNSGSNDISIVLNLGDGTFTPTVNVPVVNGVDGPETIEAGDVDGDGDVDLLVVVNVFDEDRMRILFNNGDATFGFPEQIRCDEVRAYAARLGDLDADGDLDLVVAGSSDPPQVAVRLNNGDATFADVLLFSAPEVRSGVQAVEAADFDGDGDADLALLSIAAEGSEDGVSVLLNAGDGTFGTPTVFAASGSAEAMTSGDLDGDGDMDLAVAGGFGSTASVAVFENDGTGAFTEQSQFAVTDGPTSIAAADFDGDGDLDLAVAEGDFNIDDDQVSVALNNGSGTFAVPVAFQVGNRPTGLTAADLDDDGDIDLATANEGSNNGSILINNGNAVFTRAP